MINYNKKNKIEINEQRILKAEAHRSVGRDLYRFPIPIKWAVALDLKRDDRELLVTLTKDNEIIIRKARPEDY